ncbi:MAG TPA: hypothetical protein VG323_08585 [Thermoanaerobaculia bacterium]|nr:hypothetical protein [Thermoanaerobaculia bacterium]
MRKLWCAVLAVPLMAAAQPKGVVGLGVGAASSTEVIVKVNGKNETVKLAGITNGTYAGQAFLQCLVAHRIVRVDRAANRVTMLDGSSVADHLAEFLLSKTPVDPCEIGKAAYVPATPPLASSVAVMQPGEAPAPSPGKRRGTASFGSSNSKMDPNAVKFTPSQAEERYKYAAPAQPAPTNAPTIYRPPSVGSQQVPQGSTTTLANPGTTTVQSQGTVTTPQGQTYAPPSPGTTTVPSTQTTTSPP